VRGAFPSPLLVGQNESSEASGTTALLSNGSLMGGTGLTLLVATGAFSTALTLSGEKDCYSDQS